jgi:hypothetical protein
MEIFFIFDHQVPVIILWPVIMHLAMCIYLGHDYKGINIEFLSHCMEENSVIIYQEQCILNLLVPHIDCTFSVVFVLVLK